MKGNIDRMVLRLWILTALFFSGTASASVAAVALLPEYTDSIAGGQTKQKEMDYQLRTPGVDFLEQFRDDNAFHYITKAKEEAGWWERFKRWLSERLFRSSSPSFDKWLDISIKGIAVLLVIFFIYKVTRSKFSSPFARRERLFDTAGAGMDEPVDHISYPALLEQAVSEGNYEAAVRVHYLYLLYLLDQKGIIRWNRHKTNTAYLYEIEDQQKRMTFKQLDWIFNCVCYGEFGINESIYRQVAFRFEAFQKELV